VDICGHATLASAKVLFKHHNMKENEIIFQTKSGRLSVFREEQQLFMDFPADSISQVEPPLGLLDALKINQIKFCAQSKNTNRLFLHCFHEDLLKMQPNFKKLQEIETEFGNNGFIVTTEGDNEYDFISRYFGPSAGINEDYVTGSAHIVSGPYWSNILNKQELKAYQASSRGGQIGIKIAGERIHLYGEAVVVLHGKFLLGSRDK
jgi:PhzF family phenazine biosynthesis protein